MSTLEQKKEFALKQIAPYFKDPSICGFDNQTRGCAYKGINNGVEVMCVAGKNMLPDILEEYGTTSLSISDILFALGEGQVFIPESVGILTNDEWTRLQALHDYIYNKNKLDKVIKNLGLFTLEELQEAANKL